jgi:hypothetical protein
MSQRVSPNPIYQAQIDRLRPIISLNDALVDPTPFRNPIIQYVFGKGRQLESEIVAAGRRMPLPYARTVEWNPGPLPWVQINRRLAEASGRPPSAGSGPPDRP